MTKYKINDCLDTMTYMGYMDTMAKICGVLGISKNTFHNYRKLDIDARRDIPYKIVCKIELFFKIPFGTLKNYEINLDPVEARPPKKRKPKLSVSTQVTRPSKSKHLKSKKIENTM